MNLRMPIMLYTNSWKPIVQISEVSSSDILKAFWGMLSYFNLFISLIS